MNYISIEVLPFIFIDVIYKSTRTGSIKVLSASFNGIALHMSDEQKKSITDEIRIILDNDFDEGEMNPLFTSDN